MFEIFAKNFPELFTEIFINPNETNKNKHFSISYKTNGLTAIVLTLAQSSHLQFMFK